MLMSKVLLFLGRTSDDVTTDGMVASDAQSDELFTWTVILLGEKVEPSSLRGENYINQGIKG